MIVVYLVVLVVCVMLLLVLRAPAPARRPEPPLQPIGDTRSPDRLPAPASTHVEIVEVTVIGHHPTTASSDDVSALERELGTTMPDGYREIVTTWGAGCYGHHFRIRLPAQVRDGVCGPRAYRAAMDAKASGSDRRRPDWPWEGLITPAQADDVVVVADSPGGDSIAFLRGAPHELLVLARDSDGNGRLPGSLPSALAAAGVVLELPIELPRVFVREAERVRRSFRSPEGAPVPTEESVLDVLRELGLHDGQLRDWNDPFLSVFSERLGGVITISAAATPIWEVEYDDAGIDIEAERDADVAELVRRIEGLGFVEEAPRAR